MLVDLHMHTVYSDGTDAVHELFQRSLDAGIKLISITDHDNIDAQATAMNCAQENELTYIPAVEIACKGPGTLDLLGYGISLTNSNLLSMLSSITRSRRERNIKLIERMKTIGVRISDKETDTLTEESNTGRLHFARLLAEKGYAASLKEAFDSFLKSGGKAYVERQKQSPEVVMETIRGAGGLSVLAHPLSLGLTSAELVRELKILIDNGLEGLEVFYKEYDKGTQEELLGIAARLSLVPTGGSDHHGNNKPWLTPGVEMPERFVRKFLLSINSVEHWPRMR